MKIYVLSDTHNSFSFGAFLPELEKADMIVHCGDGERDVYDIKSAFSVPIVSVAGNCDMFGDSSTVFEAEGHRILVAHGHNYGVRYSLSELEEKAQAENADIVFYGHTHIPQTDYRNGRWYINPGSLCRPREGNAPTYCILTLDKFKVYPEMKIWM